MNSHSLTSIRRVAICALLLGATVCIDHATGIRVRLGSIYLLGIALASWSLDWRVLILYVAAAVASWTGIESTVGIHNARFWLVSWDATNRLLSATLIATIVYQIKSTLDQRRRLINELRQALLELSRLKEVIPTCRICHKLHWDQGYETRLRRLLSEMADADSIGDICPECVEARVERIASVPTDEYFADRNITGGA